VAEGITETKNKVLGITLVLSILFHGLILTQMTGIFHETVFIELSLKQEFGPSVRDIPRPPEINKKEVRTKIPEPKIEKIPDIPTVNPVNPAPFPEPNDFKPIARNLVSHPAPLQERPAAAPVKTDSAFKSARDYFQTVRMKIESHKKYPQSARRKNLTGRVTVKFVIKPDGSVTNLKIVKKSKFKSLNQAALEAIKSSSPFPKLPPAYFKGVLPVQLSIVFELN
jgi:periplasmic protein TonB